jgi:MFS transporter, OFA family, oxalate/formate antiporter
MKRWKTAFAGFCVMLGPGAVCAYSLFAQPLLASLGWSTISSSAVFALSGCFLGLGAFLGGLRLEQEQEDVRRIAVVGIGIWALGNTLSGLTAIGLGSAWIFLGYGIFGGFGCGMAYIAALTAVMKWFPEKRGFGGGIVTSGFGFGSFAYALALWPMPHHIPSHAGTTIFILSGCAFFGLSLFGLLLEEPPEDDPRFILVGPQASSITMLRNPQAYIQWTMLLLNAMAGVGIIANAAPVMNELTDQSAGSAASRFLLPALFLGLGHLVWGKFYDRVGYRTAFGTLFGLSSVVFFAIGSLHNPFAITGACVLLFFCYGGGFGMMPALHADFFGVEHFATNYGITLSAWGCACFFAPLFYASIKELTGSYGMALQPMGLMLLTAIILPIIGEAAPARKPMEAPQSLPVRHLHAPAKSIGKPL